MENSKEVKASDILGVLNRKSVLKSGLHTKVCRRRKLKVKLGEMAKKTKRRETGMLETKKGRLVNNLMTYLYINIPLVTTGKSASFSKLGQYQFLQDYWK